MRTIELLSPAPAVTANTVPLAKGVPALDGRVIGLLNNSKAGTRPFLDRVGTRYRYAIIPLRQHLVAQRALPEGLVHPGVAARPLRDAAFREPGRASRCCPAVAARATAGKVWNVRR